MKCVFVTDEMRKFPKIHHNILILKTSFVSEESANHLFNLSLTKQHRLLGLRPAGSYGPTGLRPGPNGPSHPATPGAMPLALRAHPKIVALSGQNTNNSSRGHAAPLSGPTGRELDPPGGVLALPPPPLAAAPLSHAYGVVCQKGGGISTVADKVYALHCFHMKTGRNTIFSLDT